MKKKVVYLRIVLLLMFHSIIIETYSQNLVPNGAFDCYTGCPTAAGQTNLLKYWFNPTQSSPDFYNCNNPSYGTPNQNKGIQIPKKGNGYAGILATGHPAIPCGLDFREYIAVKLIQPLVAGRCYDVSFYVSLGDPQNTATDRIGLYFSNIAVNQASICVIPVIPQIESPAGTFLTDKVNWMLISGTYNALGGEEYITIGNFRNGASTNTTAVTGILVQAYYLVDDVCIKECGENCELEFTPDTLAMCLGDSVTLISNFQYGTFLWNTGATTASIKVSPPTDSLFVATLTDTFNCVTYLDSFLVEVRPIPTGTDNRSICQGSSILLGGILRTTPGIYNDTIFGGSSTGCDSVVVVTLAVNVCATSNASFIPSVTSICQGDSITFTDNSTDAGITSWNWAFNGGSPATANTQGPHTIGFNTSGIFSITLQVTDASGTDDTTVTITVLPVASSTQAQSICQGQTFTLPGGSAVSTSGTYIDTLQNVAANGCDSIVTTNLTVISPVVFNQSFTECTGFTIGVGVNTYSTTGIYNDTLTSLASGCDSIVITNLTVNTPVVTNQSFVECEGFSVTVGVNTYSTTGVFTDVINNCDTTVTDLTINPAPQFTFIKVDDNCAEGIGSVTAEILSGIVPITYNWSTGGNDSLIESLPAGTYTLIVTDNNGCTNLDSIQVNDLEIDCDFYLYLPNVFSPNGDGVNDLLLVKSKGVKIFALKIYNRWGNVVFETTSLTQGWDGKHRGVDENTGVFTYALEATFENGNTIQKNGNISLLK